MIGHVDLQKKRVQLMITIRPLAKNAQAEVDLGKGRDTPDFFIFG
jgi:hypothetical protein